MTARIAIACLCAALGACATPSPAPVTVKVPVPVYCSPPVVAVPAMPVDALADADDVYVVTRTLWAEIKIRQAYEERLLAAVESCRAKPK